jgi:hypothetical protein
MPWLRQFVAGLSLQRPRFTPVSVNVGFVVDEVTLGQVFLQALQSPLSISFHCGSTYSYIISRMNNIPSGGNISKAQSHPIDMNIIKFEI